MAECRLQMIRDGKQLIPRSCQLCGLFNRCQKFLDEQVKPKPTYEELTAENERLQRVVEQAKKAGKLRLSPEKTLIISGFGFRWEKPGDITPDLYAELLKDAQLKGADRG